MKQKKIIFVLSAVLLLIFVNSLLHYKTSYLLSTIPPKILYCFTSRGVHPVLDYIFNTHVRKTAHFIEYFLLGLAITKFYLYRINKKLDLQRIINSLILFICIGFLDETIQLFTGRGSEVSDIWIDFIGALFGLALYSLYKIIKNKISLNKSKI